MTALLADINSATKLNGVTLDTQSNNTTKTTYGAAAQDTATPLKGFFDNVADAAVVNAERFALMGAARQAYSIKVNDVLTTFDYASVTPSVTIVDSEHAINRVFLVTKIQIDIENNTTQLEVFG